MNIESLSSLANTVIPQDRTEQVTNINPYISKMRVISELPIGFFNAGVIKQEQEDTSILIGRFVSSRSGPGYPDIGSIAIATVQDGAAIKIQEIWTPEDPDKNGDLIEDVRALHHDGKVLLGLTRVARDNRRGYRPFPAIATTTIDALLSGEFPETRFIVDQRSNPDMIHLTEGKNTTPVGDDSGTILYRRELDSHRLVALSCTNGEDMEQPYYVDFQEEPIPSWGINKMGLTAPPEWLNETEALLLVHGLSLDPNTGKYSYSLGSARLYRGDDKMLHVDNISKNPFLTPDSFNKLFGNQNVELRPEERRAVYLCGAYPAYSNNNGDKTLERLILYPNVGDTRTIEATLQVPEIVESWDRTG